MRRSVRRADADPCDGISWFDADPSLYTSAPVGEVTVGFSEFMSAIEEFHQNLMTAMQARIAEVAAGPPPGVDIDFPYLHTEQADRATWLSRALAGAPTTNWDMVRAGANLIPRRTRTRP
ncbi:DUF5984 family protein [Kribbella sp. NBC_01505]|uniref:DUF5984 family protein n=1 Tax=Kribbella sp. NBC_01505 TaxID=2903580 RepID=UPI00386BB8F4